MQAETIILDAGLRLYDRLERLASTEQHTKEDLLILSFISELLRNDCYYSLFSKKQREILIHSFNKTVASNSVIPFFRIDHNLYKNIGGKQNLTDFQVIEDRLNINL